MNRDYIRIKYKEHYITLNFENNTLYIMLSGVPFEEMKNVTKDVIGRPEYYKSLDKAIENYHEYLDRYKGEDKNGK